MFQREIGGMGNTRDIAHLPPLIRRAKMKEKAVEKVVETPKVVAPKIVEETKTFERVHEIAPEVPALHGKILAGRDDLKKQLIQVKEVIDARVQELEVLRHKKAKLEGAIEISDLYLK